MGNANGTEGEKEMAEAEQELHAAEGMPEGDETRGTKISKAKAKIERAKLKINVEQATLKRDYVLEHHKNDEQKIKDVCQELIDAQKAMNHEEEVKRREELNDPVRSAACLSSGSRKSHCRACRGSPLPAVPLGKHGRLLSCPTKAQHRALPL